MRDTIIPRSTVTEKPAHLSMIDRLARRAIHEHLRGIRDGRLTLIEGNTSFAFGDSGDVNTLTVHDPRFYRHVFTAGSLGAAESYIQGLWSTESLTGLLRLFVRNIQVARGMQRGITIIARQFARFGHWMRQNTRLGSRRNIHAHYDIGNDLFELFLDKTMTYSAAYFTHDSSSLFEASNAKLDRLCRKLDLHATDHLLEIGTGWGSMAIHAAKHYGCRVTTTTISDEQFKLAKQRVKDAGLADRITLLKQDYRDLTGQYDKLVSIEMIEAVGHNNLDAYFSSCRRLLKPEGAMAIQAINMNEQHYPTYLKSPDFIQRYVFPGSCCPALSAIARSIGRTTDMRIIDIEDIGLHYARTLAIWRHNFFENIEAVRALGYTDQFIRLWEYYLCYCEAGFAERYIGNVQMVMTGPHSSVTPTAIPEMEVRA